MLDTHVGWHSRWIYKGMCCFSNAYIPYAQPNSRIICTFKSNFNNVPLIQDKEILYFNKYFLIKLPYKMYQFTQVLKNCIVYFIASELNFTASHITSCLQLFLERLSEIMCMRQSWKVNMGYDQYTVADTNRSCLIYFRCFPLARTNIHPWSRVILSNFFEKQWTQNHPQYLLCTFSDNISQNSCIWGEPCSAFALFLSKKKTGWPACQDHSCSSWELCKRGGWPHINRS